MEVRIFVIYAVNERGRGPQPAEQILHSYPHGITGPSGRPQRCFTYHGHWVAAGPWPHVCQYGEAALLLDVKERIIQFGGLNPQRGPNLETTSLPQLLSIPYLPPCPPGNSAGSNLGLQTGPKPIGLYHSRGLVMAPIKLAPLRSRHQG